ncbi:MAG: glycosyltransferase, partial [Pseudomonadota bacterium]|nr:glycosyltransferase [Pseudomonadota bacterium]
MNNISVFLVVKNEAHNIERVLNSVKGFDDIVVVDSDSTDNTMELAAHYTDRLYNHEWQGMAVQKEYAKSLCKHDWVLNLDADEELTEELK